jgi:hypothetical protein
MSGNFLNYFNLNHFMHWHVNRKTSGMNWKKMLYGTVLGFAVGGPAVAESVKSPTYADIPYGSSPLQVLDVYLARSDSPTPVVVYIHGGGWTSGDKTKMMQPSNKHAQIIEQLLQKGVTVISVEYRKNGNGTTLPIPVHDAARAIQFIRSKAEEWNLDKSRVAAWGGSAGGSTSLWLAFHDDLADPESRDSVERESTRLCGAVSQNGQSMIDPKWMIENIGRKGAAHSMICTAVGEKDLDGVLEHYSQYRELYAEFSPMTHLTSDDPPYFGLYQMKSVIPAPNSNYGIHNRVFGVKMKEKSDAIGHVGYLSGEPDSKYENELQFFEAIFFATDKQTQ